MDPTANTELVQQTSVHYADQIEQLKSEKKKFEIFFVERYAINTDFPYKNVELEVSQNFLALAEKCPRENLPLELNGDMNLALLQMQLFNTEKRLEIVHRRKVKQRRNMKRQWHVLEKNETELRQQFMDFEQFVKENSEKKIRAEKKIAEEKDFIRNKESEIQNYTDQIMRLQRVKNHMNQNFKKYKIYREYLQDVVNYTSEFNSISDLLSRYRALTEAKGLLSKLIKQNINILKHSKYNMMKLIEEKNFAIMGLNNQIANLQARYENANIKALESETLVTQIKNNAVRQLSEINMVKNSIWNVYVHMAASKKHPIKIKKENVEEQMMYINRTLTELSKVNKLIKKRSIKGK